MIFNRSKRDGKILLKDCIEVYVKKKETLKKIQFFSRSFITTSQIRNNVQQEPRDIWSLHSYDTTLISKKACLFCLLYRRYNST